MKVFVALFCMMAVVAAATTKNKASESRDKRGIFGLGYGHSEPLVGYSAPAVISVDKVVNVPKVVTVPEVVKVNKVVSVPQVVTVNKVVAAPAYHAPLALGYSDLYSHSAYSGLYDHSAYSGLHGHSLYSNLHYPSYSYPSYGYASGYANGWW